MDVVIRFYRAAIIYIQRADDIIVILPVEAGEKHFDVEKRVKLINPRITAEGYKIGTRGFTNYILHADINYTHVKIIFTYVFFFTISVYNIVIGRC